MTTQPDVRSPLPGREPRTLALLAVVLALVGVGVGVLLNLAGEILEAVGANDGVALWDRPALDWALANREPTFTAALLWYTHVGGAIWQPVIVVLVGGFLWWRWKDPTPAALLAISELGALALTLATKRYVGRARPPIADAVPPYETSPSFPSGHTLQAFVFATMLSYLLIRHLWDHPAWQRVVVGLIGLGYASLMGFSRVFLGYHWVTDVLAAAALGLAWSFAIIACHRVWRTVRHREERAPIEEEKKRPALPRG